MKIVNIDSENVHIFWMNWGISMKFFRKDVTCDNMKNHKKSQASRVGQIDRPSLFRVMISSLTLNM